MSVDDLPHTFNPRHHPILYHYTSAATARVIAKNPALWLSEYTALNDTTEFTYGRDRLIALLQQREVYVDAAARLCMVMALEGLEANTGLMIGSLTTRSDDLGQWRAYGDSASGCVIGIDAEYLSDRAGVAVRTVIYDPDTVDRILRAGLTVLQQTYEENPEDIAAVIEISRWLASDLFAIKHPAFADEREVRVSRMLVGDGVGGLIDVGGNDRDRGIMPELSVGTRAGAFGPTRYLSLPLTSDGGRHAIRSVGFGPAMSADERAAQSRFFATEGIETWMSALPFRR
ncbi:DUF2971 domain-containing protein [Brevundimonas aurifodinae]|uniref:DUF2971 domain-containing protein n=1 Tax=Brevundimonas aurifodinae TaxID=1508312 RepID=A0ABV1NJQ7_9CAUL